MEQKSMPKMNMALQWATVFHPVTAFHLVYTTLFSPSGFVCSGAARQTGGSAQAPSAGSRQNHNNQNWQVPCRLGCNRQKRTGTFPCSMILSGMVTSHYTKRINFTSLVCLFIWFIYSTHVGSISWNRQRQSPIANLCSQIGKILACSPHISTAQAFDSMEDALSQFFMTNAEAPSTKEQ